MSLVSSAGGNVGSGKGVGSPLLADRRGERTASGALWGSAASCTSAREVEAVQKLERERDRRSSSEAVVARADEAAPSGKRAHPHTAKEALGRLLAVWTERTNASSAECAFGTGRFDGQRVDAGLLLSRRHRGAVA